MDKFFTTTEVFAMNWQSISEVEIWNSINECYARMSQTQKRLWDVIKITPEKWDQNPWGAPGNGFWAVAIIGDCVIWYNDIELGFNRSKYLTFGEIEEYFCNQDNLEEVVQYVINEIQDGCDAAPRCSPPL